jgi:hypothetical protein
VRAIKANRTIRFVTMRDNSIGVGGSTALAHMLANNTVCSGRAFEFFTRAFAVCVNVVLSDSAYRTAFPTSP